MEKFSFSASELLGFLGGFRARDAMNRNTQDAMNRVCTESRIKIALFAVLLLLGFSFCLPKTYAATFTACPSDGEAGDDDATKNGVITLNVAHTWQADTTNKGVFDCGALNVVINSTLTAQSYIATQDVNPNDDFGVYIKTTGNITISSSGVIDANGKGYTSGKGPSAGITGNAGSGGTYGGSGGCSSQNICSGLPVGSSLNPVYLGSGGGNGQNRGFIAGGLGGGAVILNGNNVVINGSILASGTSGNGKGEKYAQNEASGGGSGGSINIVSQALSGNGVLNVSGGNGGSVGGFNGGGGTGGRISINYNSYNFSTSKLHLNYVIKGGMNRGGSAVEGGEGTIAFLDSSTTPISLYLIGNFEFMDVDLASKVFSFYNLKIENTSVRIQQVNDYASSFDIKNNLTLINSNISCGVGSQKKMIFKVEKNIDIDSSSSIICDGNGYSAATGPGAGITANSAGGGSYGGKGGTGTGRSTGAGGSIYDSVFSPKELGSGGGNGQNRGFIAGGAGGGRIEMFVNGNVVINGKLTVNGFDGAGKGESHAENEASGGGSGGSIFLNVKGALTGNGILNANGGKGGTVSDFNGGGGAGGRIAVYYNSATLGLNIDGLKDSIALGGKSGNNSTKADDGTTAFIDNSTTPISLSIFNTGKFELRDDDMIDSAFIFTNLKVENSNVNFQDGVKVMKTVNIKKDFSLINSKFTCGTGNEKGVFLYVEGNFNMDNASKISCDANGYSAGQGPGAGGTAQNGAGGAYGGLGGKAKGSGVLGLALNPYFSAFTPKDFGSGGGNGQNRGFIAGGIGGGSIEIIVNKDAVISGIISVNGTDGTGKSESYGQNEVSGGGAGGSILLNVSGVLSGSGSLISKGGNGGLVGGQFGGGGSGGRISVYYDSSESSTNIDTLKNSIASGGTYADSSKSGEDGTVAFFDKSTSPVSLNVFLGKRFEFMDADFDTGFYDFTNLNIEGANVRVESKGLDRIIRISKNLLIKNSDIAFLKSTLFQVGGNATITHSDTNVTKLHAESGKAWLKFNVAGDLMVSSKSYISADNAGNDGESGPGAGSSLTVNNVYSATGGGGSYGGKGAAGVFGGLSGNIYGVEDDPKDFGSGGGNGIGFNTIVGPKGGGILDFVVGRDAIIDGVLSANGQNGGALSGSRGAGIASGGGSGGSIVLRVKNILNGAGKMTANGGSGGSVSSFIGGPGGGGRIFVSYVDSLSGTLLDSCGTGLTETCANVKVDEGGTGGTWGSERRKGTVFIKKDSVIPVFQPKVGVYQLDELRCAKVRGSTESTEKIGSINFDAFNGLETTPPACLNYHEELAETISPISLDNYQGLGFLFQGMTHNDNLGYLSFSCHDFDGYFEELEDFCERGSRYQVYRTLDGLIRGLAWSEGIGGFVWFNYWDPLDGGCEICGRSKDGKTDYRPRIDPVITTPGSDFGKAFLHGKAWVYSLKSYLSLEGSYIQIPSECVTSNCIFPPKIDKKAKTEISCSIDDNIEYVYEPVLLPNTGTPKVIWDGTKVSGDPALITIFDKDMKKLSMNIPAQYCKNIPFLESKEAGLMVSALNNQDPFLGGWGSLGGFDSEQWKVKIKNDCLNITDIVCSPVAPTTNVSEAFTGSRYEIKCKAMHDEKTSATKLVNWSISPAFGVLPAGMINEHNGIEERIYWDIPSTEDPSSYLIRIGAKNDCTKNEYVKNLPLIVKKQVKRPKILSTERKAGKHYYYNPLLENKKVPPYILQEGTRPIFWELNGPSTATIFTTPVDPLKGEFVWAFSGLDRGITKHITGIQARNENVWIDDKGNSDPDSFDVTPGIAPQIIMLKKDIIPENSFYPPSDNKIYQFTCPQDNNDDYSKDVIGTFDLRKTIAGSTCSYFDWTINNSSLKVDPSTGWLEWDSTNFPIGDVPFTLTVSSPWGSDSKDFIVKFQKEEQQDLMISVPADNTYCQEGTSLNIPVTITGLNDLAKIDFDDSSHDAYPIIFKNLLPEDNLKVGPRTSNKNITWEKCSLGGATSEKIYNLKLVLKDLMGNDLATSDSFAIKVGKTVAEPTTEPWTEKVYSSVKGTVSVRDLNQNTDQKFSNVGDESSVISRDIIYSNVVSLTKGVSKGNTKLDIAKSIINNPALIKLDNDNKLKISELNVLRGETFSNGDVLYFEDKVVRIGKFPGVASACDNLNFKDNHQTIIVNGGNLYIDCNLWSTGKGVLDIVVLKDLTGNNDQPSGNIYIDKNVTSLGQVHIYADGSLFRYDAGDVLLAINRNVVKDKAVPTFFKDMNCKEANNNNFGTFAQCMDDNLPNQFKISGSVVSKNTIGGLKVTNNSIDSVNSVDGYGQKITTDPVYTAAAYDFNLFSFFHLNFYKGDCTNPGEFVKFKTDGTKDTCKALTGNNLVITDQVVKRSIGKKAEGIDDPESNDSTFNYEEPSTLPTYPREAVIFDYAPIAVDSKVFK